MVVGTTVVVVTSVVVGTTVVVVTSVVVGATVVVVAALVVVVDAAVVVVSSHSTRSIASSTMSSTGPPHRLTVATLSAP